MLLFQEPIQVTIVEIALNHSS